MRAHRQALVAVVATLAAAFSTAAAQQAVRWQTNLDAARQTAAQSNRLLLIHFWSETCGPCARMERDVFSRPEVAATLEANYVPVKVNVRQFPMTAQQFGVTSWPTDLVVTPHGQVLDRSVGYQPPAAYVARLTQVALAARSQPLGVQGSVPYGRVPSAMQPALVSQGTAPAIGATASAGSISPAMVKGSVAFPTGSDSQSNTPAQSWNRWRFSTGPEAAPAGATHQPQPGQGNAGYQQAPDDSGRRYGSAVTSPVSSGSPLGQPPAGASAAYSPSSPLQSVAGAGGPENFGLGGPYGSVPRPSESLSASSSFAGASSPPASSSSAGFSFSPPSLASGENRVGQNQPSMGQPVGGATLGADTGRVGDVPASAAWQSGRIDLMNTAPWQSNAPSGGKTDRPAPARANPPLALDGYCAVSLAEKERWVRGNPRFGVIHEGRTYLFAGPDEARRFYNDPDRYAPVASGNDVVLLAERGQQVPGRREHGAWYEGRVYLFADEDSYARFAADPGRYAARFLSPSGGASSAEQRQSTQTSAASPPGSVGSPSGSSAASPAGSPGIAPGGSGFSASEPSALRPEPPWRQ